MNHMDLCLRIERLVKISLNLPESKDSNTNHLSGLIEADGLTNRCAFAAFCASLTPHYVKQNTTDDHRDLINQSINKYNFLTSLDEQRYWEVLEDACEEYEVLLKKLSIL
ncbi:MULTISPECIES: hypothetical protein [Metabacillus]|uniref:hypothetical protein n=1 Tax=Metabacillus TaxID=2675233 RepID=UPI000C7FB993|nr:MULTISPECIES: hypothetical protein [Metabacillus]MCM3443621.1 hypothetical protein [Metabacillus halosaccharovorans]PMC34221.1 hypothetical protein CJ195_24185 [Bacillus sp. UMB0899]